MKEMRDHVLYIPYPFLGVSSKWRVVARSVHLERGPVVRVTEVFRRCPPPGNQQSLKLLDRNGRSLKSLSTEA